MRRSVSIAALQDLLHLIYDTPTRPVNPCLLSDDVDPSKSWLLCEVQTGTDTDSTCPPGFRQA